MQDLMVPLAHTRPGVLATKGVGHVNFVKNLLERGREEATAVEQRKRKQID